MELQTLIARHKVKILNLGVIIFSLIVANNIYKSQTRSIQTLKERIGGETRKNELLSNISQTEKMISVYSDILNKKDISLAVNTITNIASESGVKIVLIKPATAEKYPAYIKYPLNLTVIAKSYHAIGKFLHRVEIHPDVYFVEKINVRPIDTSQELTNKEYNLTADLRLSTILFKDKE